MPADHSPPDPPSSPRPGFLAAMLGSFRPEDLQPRAAGAVAGAPGFVGVGVGKAGTSWWHDLLLRHPAVSENRLLTKELHFFDHLRLDPITGPQIALYHEAFAVPPTKLCGEWSPNYLTWPMALENLARAAPRARILVILRNPVDRTLSAVNQQHTALLSRFRFTPEERYIYETYTIFPRTLTNSLYADGLRRLWRLFGRERVLVLQYERCKESPASELARTYRFLGIDPDFVPDGLRTPVNRVDYVVPGFSPAQRAWLADYLRADVDATLALCPEIDPSLWHDFRPAPDRQ